ncbi:hypothetical protein V6V47_24260 [Micromonospora sp. CPCC 205539]|uniref:hypothetical protein n=1 Tax=Micromonospora sp. CPCC 205539 TaxID=3122408 RepID=UPI002FF41D5E
MEILTQIRSDAVVERLLCHPHLALVAGWDADRPAIRIWEFGDGQLREFATVGADCAVYGDDDRFERTPSATWLKIQAAMNQLT